MDGPYLIRLWPYSLRGLWPYSGFRELPDDARNVAIRFFFDTAVLQVLHLTYDAF